MRPSGLPKVRDQMLRYIVSDTSQMHDALMATPNGELSTLAQHLPDATLYWVTADMAALAVAAGAQLDSVLWSDRPARAGLMVFDGDIGCFDFSDGVEVPISALAWAPGPGMCHIWVMQSRARLAEVMPERAYWFTPENIPPLIPLNSIAVPASRDSVAVADVEPAWLVPLTTLAASWLLMEQPVLVDRSIDRPGKAARRADARAGRETPEVAVIDLRRQYVPQGHDADSTTDGRHYHHRFVVSGHWRNQAHGPEHSLRRRQWIPSYVKGPDGAPLLVTEKVNVWRR